MMMGFFWLACYQYRSIQDLAIQRTELVSKIDTLEQTMVSQDQDLASEQKKLASKVDTLERTMVSQIQDLAIERNELLSKIGMLEQTIVSQVQEIDTLERIVMKPSDSVAAINKSPVFPPDVNAAMTAIHSVLRPSGK